MKHQIGLCLVPSVKNPGIFFLARMLSELPLLCLGNCAREEFFTDLTFTT